MGDFVDKEQVEQIRAHYKSYQFSPNAKFDNRAAPLLAGVYDASTFRECSTWYVNRLLRYIEMEEFFNETAKIDCDDGVTKLQHECGGCGFKWPSRSAYDELVLAKAELESQLAEVKKERDILAQQLKDDER